MKKSYITYQKPSLFHHQVHPLHVLVVILQVHLLLDCKAASKEKERDVMAMGGALKWKHWLAV
jgi:hypothetical protein